jgi:hypothetical protein
MASLDSALRGLLERTIIKARAEAEAAAKVALDHLAVNDSEAHAAMPEEERELRRTLRARMRQIGGYDRLTEECAYEQWHRMLFARFLAENGLLMHPAGVAVSLSECAEIAAEEGERDAWAIAARYAAGMLPGIFKESDPVLKVRLAPEGRLALEGLLEALPIELFAADDSLGWIYQFWQTEQKKKVNQSEV